MPIEDSFLGLTLGHYRIIESIGSGGMGEVYRARDEHLDREVAIKVLRRGTLADEASRKRFRQEALALSKLNHPNIATIHDFDTQKDVEFLVMEYIPGITLSEKLPAGPLPEKQVLRLGIQLAEGLAAAHEQGVVHRDLKPGNLRLTTSEWLKILDFGLAELQKPSLETDAADAAPESQKITGTLAYMAPEQLAGEASDARTDIHAAGLVLYEMATGQRPFSEVPNSQLVGAILHKPPRPPTALIPGISPELERIIGKCLEKEPKNRYQSANELAIDLRRLSAPSTIGVALPERQRRAAGLVWAAVAILAAAGAYLLALNGNSFRPRWLGKAGAPGIRSLAVLPLENMSGDPSQEYFVEGMTEELIRNLGKIAGMRVISRTSVMQYKGTKKTVPTIAGELGVDAVVEGSVLRSGNQARISALLIQAQPERQVWSDSYEGSLQDVLRLQNEVAQAVAREIEVQLTPQEQARLGQTRTVNPQAHDDYLRGRYYWNKRTGESIQKSIEYFQRAAEEDPQYAPAYAGLADAYHVLWVYSGISPKDMHQRAKEAALKAVELDDTLAEAHTSLAAIAADDDWDFAAGEKEYLRAIALNPNYATARQWYAELLAYTGRFDEALSQIQKAKELDPLSLVINLTAGDILVHARRYDQAIEQLHKTMELEKNFWLAHSDLRDAYEYKGMFKEAIVEIEASRAAQGDSPEQARREADLLRAAYRKGGERGYWRARLENAGQKIKSGKATSFDEAPYRMASFYVRLGDVDCAVDWLEKALERRDIGLVYVRTAPEFEGLLSDPRIVKILQQAGFTH